MRYRSSATLLGIPVVDVVVRSGAHDGAVRVARGWIAVGDVAFGVLFAAGGVAIGGLSVGGVSIGGLAIAGLSVGLWSAGGLALGVVAFGGAAIAISAAAGGLAVAGGHAVGGLAIAAHANDDVARTYFQTGGFLGLTYIASRFSDWIIAVLVGLIALVWVFREE
jgi:hypothetical protein